MHFFFKQLVLFLLFLGVVQGRTLEELQVAYEVRMLGLEKEHLESLTTLKTGYLRALAGVQEKLQKSGRLDDVLAVVREKKDLEADVWPLARLVESAPADLIRVRKLYETARIRTNRGNAEAVIETTEKMEALLSQQVISLTKAGEIAEARKAREQLETIKNSSKLKEARQLVKRVRLNQRAPMAMRIRRSGDNLEVIVRYDKSGEVGLDSPVENVVELTGGKKEKGDTAAKVLGEFIGANAYAVDSYVAFESDMEKITPPMSGVSLDLKAGVEVEKRRALRILMPEKALNPRVEWRELLEPLASASRVRLDFLYFIPKENQKLLGFSFDWAFRAPFEEKVMDTTGRWVTQSLESDSLNEMSHLRLFVKDLHGSDKTFNGGNESIYLDDLTVTYIAFAAHLVADYKDGKVFGEIVADPSAQKPIALAGKLLSSKLK